MPASAMKLRRWLEPGLGVKRWLAVIFGGLVLVALGVAHLIRQAARDLQPGGLAQLLLDATTLQFLPFALRGATVALLGLALVALGGLRLIRSLTEPLREPDGDDSLVDLLHRRRSLSRGPRVVAIGGGTGQSILLRGLKETTANLTAVVSVADDGGSSGSLRSELGIPPVGDIRNCLVALADTEPLMRDLLQYRFPVGAVPAERDPMAAAGSVPTSDHTRPEPGTLGGHSLGNLMIAALTELHDGDIEEGVRQMNRVLAVRGQVVPVSATPLTLHARLADGSTVDGQSTIARTAGIERVWITPEAVRPAAEALAAIAAADLIVLGPGSLFTSVLPIVLIPEIRAALAAAAGLRVYVCNAATQDGETAGLDLADHVEALVDHAGAGIVDVVLANRLSGAHEPEADDRAEPVRFRWPPVLPAGGAPRLILDDVVDPVNAHHHDPARLADALFRILATEGATRRTAGIARPG